MLARAAGLIWGTDPRTLPRWRAAAVRVARVVWATTADLIDGRIFLHASSLVYTTLLSMVPLLALAFSLLKGLGLQGELQPIVQKVLKPIGPEAVAITQRLFEFVENVNAGVLGAVGLAFLIYTTVSVGRKIESAFNETWHVAQGRSLTRSLSQNLVVLIIGPLLLIVALGLVTALFRSTQAQELSNLSVVGGLVGVAARWAPALVAWIGLSILYQVLPNTTVHWVPSLIGGAVATVLWWLAGNLFSTFVSTSGSYTAIYSAFAALIVFLIWLNAAWVILLLGSDIAYHCQFPPRPSQSERDPPPALRRRAATLAMLAIAQAHYRDGGGGATIEELSKLLEDSPALLDGAICDLKAGGLILEAAEAPRTFLPARPLEATPAAALWAATDAGTAEPGRVPDAAVGEAWSAYDRMVADAVEAALTGRTIKDLAFGDGVVAAPATPAEDAPG